MLRNRVASADGEVGRLSRELREARDKLQVHERVVYGRWNYSKDPPVLSYSSLKTRSHMGTDAGRDFRFFYARGVAC